MKTMYVFSDGGLGNRLNSLLGGLMSADYTLSQPVICWPINNWCGCNFSDLFATDLPVTNDNLHSIFLEDNRHYLIHDNQTDKNLLNRYNHNLESLMALKHVTEDIVYFHNKIPNYFSEDLFYEKLKHFKIKKSIIESVEKFCLENNINRQTKGVHLRKTDHGKQLDSDLLFSQIQSDRNSQYFVCSDDKDTEEHFDKLANVKVLPKTSYVEKLVEGSWTASIKDTEGRNFSYNVNRSTQSVVEAFADLLILSRTNIIIRNKSSFLGWAKIYSKLDSFKKYREH